MTSVVIAALPRELASLTRDWKRVGVARKGVIVWRQQGRVAACAGMGGARAAVAMEAAVGEAPDGVDEVVSFGLAGGCSAEMHTGEAFWCGAVVDARTGEHFGSGGPVLVTSDVIAGVGEKRRLRESYGAALVDMEAATLARLAAARGLRFRALKGVSDGPEVAMGGMDQFVTSQGLFREGAFAAHVAVRPALWRQAIAMGRDSNAALRRATAMLNESWG